MARSTLRTPEIITMIIYWEIEEFIAIDIYGSKKIVDNDEKRLPVGLAAF
jgi:hypothetical protein